MKELAVKADQVDYGEEIRLEFSDKAGVHRILDGPCCNGGLLYMHAPSFPYNLLAELAAPSVMGYWT
jgi:hypothetical protein